MRRSVQVAILVVVTVLVTVAMRPRLHAQTPATGFTLDDILSAPFPENLTAAPAGGAIAWTFNERGHRNIYVAEPPDVKARQLTAYDQDDGQELTNLSFSDDGRTIVFVRGGDHGSNWPAEGNLMPNPASATAQPKMQVWSIALNAKSPVLLGEGDDAVIAPKTHQVAFVRDRRIWLAPLDGSKPAEQAFFAKGSSESPVWSPDGTTLAFVSNREDHSFIGLFVPGQPIRYLAPSTSRDSSPAWSLDGKEIAFVRQPGRGGTPRPATVVRTSGWSLWVTPADPDKPGRRPKAVEAWKSGDAPVDAPVRIAGSMNLTWAADDHLVFMSYQDGWPHLYSLPHPGDGGKPLLLTPGRFMVENATLTPDHRQIVYNANTGTDQYDIDRRHLFKVGLDSPQPAALTSGSGIEWTPVVTSDNKTVAYLASSAQRSPLPTVISIDGGAPTTLAADRVPARVPTAALVTPESVILHAPDGLEVHAQLFKTSGGEPRKPALVYVHGGPPRQMLLGWHYMGYYANDYAANQYLASRGFIVLSVNYRLGIGYGHAFQYPAHGGARGAAEYQDALAGGRYLAARPDVDPKRLGIWGGSYGGYLTALALGRNSDVFAAGVDIHGVHNWDRQGSPAPDLKAALAGDGITEDDLRAAAKVTYESSPISAVSTWKSPVLLIHGDDDRNVEFHQTVDLEQRLLEKGVKVETLVIPDDIHDFLLFRSWLKVTSAGGQYFERMFMKRAAGSQP